MGLAWPLIVIGVVLLIVAVIAKISILYVVGGIAVAVGVALLILAAVKTTAGGGRGGRRGRR